MVFWMNMGSMKFCVFLISIFFSGCLCLGSDTILAGQSLYQNQTIISKQGKFELGFFAPGKSSNYYLGIWYKNIPVQTVVWVANRNNPIRSANSSSRLEMSNGSLILYVDSEINWMISVASVATEAVILDTGNFVLRNSSGTIIWQSFDYPTDTWLPGAKLGFRRFSGVDSKLVSWKNPDNPASGNFSLGMEPDGGSELLLRGDSSTKLWRSGVLQGETYSSFYYNFTYVSRDDSVFLQYNFHGESAMSRIVLDYSGIFKRFLWSDPKRDWFISWSQPSDACESYAMCGPNAICDINFSPMCSCLDMFVPLATQDWHRFDYSKGCVRMRPLLCTDGIGEAQFMKVDNIRLPEKPESLEIVRSGVCALVCGGNCSCNAYSYDSGGGCLLFMNDMLDLIKVRNNSGGGDLYVRTDSVPPRKGKTGKRHAFPLILAVPITAAVLISCVCLYYMRQKLKSKESEGAHQNLLLLDLSSSGSAAYNKRTTIVNSQGDEKNSPSELPIFSFSSIAACTDNFSITNKLGEGGFGPVYKGELLNGQFVALKRLSRRSGQGLEEFRNETELIAKLQHRNLVGILGCCIENDEKILVYEYMPNKSLDFFLYEPTKKELLDWKRRVHVIEGIAQGLLYLHHYSRLRIVHRDLKASNILLDAEMNPKISDFGMARIFGGNDLEANTKRIVGTYGYMSPEYAMEGLFSVKSDVFAFGVLMLEIISGKKNTGFYGSDYLSLLGYAWNMWKHDRVLELIDPVIEIPSSSSSTLLRYIRIGLLCVQESPADRPSMSDIVAMLNNEEREVASPQHPAFTVGRRLAKAKQGEGKAQICSVNGLTLSHMEPR